jgi:ERF superfamily protein
MTDLLDMGQVPTISQPQRAKLPEKPRQRKAAPTALPAVQEEVPRDMLSAIVMLAKDPSVDVGKLGALVEMQERMELRQAKVEFSRSLTRLSGKLPRVKKNGTVDLGAGKGSFAFAKWEDMDKIIRPLMDEEGFTLSFDSEPRADQGGGIVVTGELLHRDGHSKTSKMALPLDTGPGRNNLQAMGSSLSYGKRYCAEMLLNIVREGADDDGVKGGVQFIGPGQLATIRKLLAETNTSEIRFLETIGVAELTDIKVGEFTIAVNLLNAKRAAAK